MGYSGFIRTLIIPLEEGWNRPEGQYSQHSHGHFPHSTYEEPNNMPETFHPENFQHQEQEMTRGCGGNQEDLDPPPPYQHCQEEGAQMDVQMEPRDQEPTQNAMQSQGSDLEPQQQQESLPDLHQESLQEIPPLENEEEDGTEVEEVSTQEDAPPRKRRRRRGPRRGWTWRTFDVRSQ